MNRVRGVISGQSCENAARVHRLAERSGADAVIVCGDFNMAPDSALYHYMVNGELNVDGLNR